MKKLYMLLLLTPMLAAQDQKLPVLKTKPVKEICGPRIGDKAYAFKAESTQGVIDFPTQFKGKWIIFFSHPADFTPVCKTEFARLSKMADEFKKMNTVLVGISVDEEYTHQIWMSKLAKETKREVKFPVIADPEMKVVYHYGMIHPKDSMTQTVRSVFIIDPKAKIRAIFFYPIANGRSFNEVKRLLVALQTTDREKVATPADWVPGKPTIPLTKAKKDIMPKS